MRSDRLGRVASSAIDPTVSTRLGHGDDAHAGDPAAVHRLDHAGGSPSTSTSSPDHRHPAELGEHQPAERVPVAVGQVEVAAPR